MCERFYRVLQFDWTAAQTSNTLLQEIKFPDVIYAQPYIYDKFRDYMGMRSDVTFYIRITSSAWNYGALMCGWVPDYDSTSTSAFRHQNVVSLSQCNGFSMQATTGVSQERTITWEAPLPFMLIAAIGSSGHKSKIGSLFIRVLNQLEAAGGSTPDPVTVSVYAKFKNLVLMGYSPSDNVSSTTTTRKVVLKTQSKTTKEAKAKNSSISGVAEATSTIKGILGSVMDAAEVVGSLMETLGPLASLAALDKPTQVMPPHPVYTDYLATLNHGKGIDMGVKIAINPDAVVSVEGACVASLNPQPSLADLIMRPTFVRTFKFTPASVQGTWSYWVLNPANSPKVLTSTDRWPDGVWQPTYMAYYSQFFKRWRGSFKILLEVVASPNTVCDIRIAHFPEVPNFTAPLDDYDGDIVSELISIHGPKEIERTMGYVSIPHWHELDDVTLATAANSIGCFGITLDSKISTIGSDVTSNIYVNMYVAAGPDMSFMQYRSPPLAPQIDPQATTLTTLTPPSGRSPIKTQANLQDSFTKPFQGIRAVSLNPEVGFINADPVCHITDMAHRYVYRGGPETLVSPGPWQFQLSPTFYAAGPLPYNQNTITGMLTYPFLHWRGAMRGCYENYDTDNTLYEFYVGGTYEIQSQYDSTSNGSVRQYKRGQPLFWELPWNAGRMHNDTVPTRLGQEEPIMAVFPTTAYTEGTAIPTLSACSNSRILQSIGDDFSIGSISACPAVGLLLESSKEDLDALNLSATTLKRVSHFLFTKGKAPEKSTPSPTKTTSSNDQPF